MIFAFLLGIFTLILWIFIDFKSGRKRHALKTKQRVYPKRFSSWQLFGNGHDLYRTLFQDIHEAKHHVHVLFYIIKDDEISMDFLNLLKKKAQSGVTVRLLLDRMGGNRLPKKEIGNLKEAGVLFSYSNRVKLPYLFYTLNYRNHRKITVIDGNIGYFGGFNIGKEYIGQDPKLGFWRDFHVKIVEDGVQDLQTEFLHDWKRAKNQEYFLDKDLFPKLSLGPTTLRFIPSNGVYIKDFLINLIDQAKEEIFIGSPYFIPGYEVNGAILKALQRGVKVSIIVPMKADHAFVKEAAFPYFKPLLKAGCSIYQYDEGFYHGKTIIIDQKLCDFGTANFDKRSLYINDELNCLIEDPAFVQRIYSEMLEDMNNSEQLTLERFKKRPLLQKGREIATHLFSGLL